MKPPEEVYSYCNVMLLKHSDFERIIGGHACMPTSSEIATIRRRKRLTQFRTDVEFASSMSQDAVKEKLEQLFPYLQNRR